MATRVYLTIILFFIILGMQTMLWAIFVIGRNEELIRLAAHLCAVTLKWFDKNGHGQSKLALKPVYMRPRRCQTGMKIEILSMHACSCVTVTKITYLLIYFSCVLLLYFIQGFVEHFVVSSRSGFVPI